MTQSPLLGFNNNVKHRGRLFHIQTEDSGVRHPHVITHLFMDGGRILKSIKTSYSEHLGSDKLTQLVRELMKEQHKMMFIALRDGQFDQALDSVPPPSTSTPPVLPHGSFPPASARTVPGTTSASPPVDRRGAVNVPAARPSAVAPSKDPAPAVASPPPIPTAAKSPSVTMPAAPVSKSASGTMPAAMPPAIPVSGASASRPYLPSSASMKAAHADGSGPSTGVRPVPRREAPELFGGAAPESAVVVGEQAAAAAAPAPAKGKEQPGSGRYAASRPAAIFSNVRNAEAGGSIFGDDLISEKSLDEVILSYLSDDLDATKK